MKSDIYQSSIGLAKEPHTVIDMDQTYQTYDLKKSSRKARISSRITDRSKRNSSKTGQISQDVTERQLSTKTQKFQKINVLSKGDYRHLKGSSSRMSQEHIRKQDPLAQNSSLYTKVFGNTVSQNGAQAFNRVQAPMSSVTSEFLQRQL